MSNSSLESTLKVHIDALCSSPRSPLTPGYFRAQDYLRDELRKCGLDPLDQKFNVRGLGECTNIYAEWGDPSKPRVLLGGHYESRGCSGVAADDNASACAVLLELIPLLRLNSHFSFTVIFFDMEENYTWSSLRGSRAFARFYPKALSKVIVLDLVGGTLAPHFEKTFLQFGPALSCLHHSNAEFLHLPMRIVEPFGSIGARSDYDEFRKKKIPYTFISSGTPWYYHTEYDTPDILSYPKMAALTEALAQALNNPVSNNKENGDWNNFHRFVEKFAQTEKLQTKRITRFAQSKKIPSPIDMALLYWDILPILRREGPKLWQKADPR